MGILTSITVIGSLVIGQAIPITNYVPKETKFAGAYSLKDLPKQYHAYTIKTGNDGATSLLPLMMLQGGGTSTKIPNILDIFSVSYTAGETIVSEGADYLVAYVPNMARIGMVGLGSPADIQLDLTLIRKDKIVSYGPREDLSPEKFASLFPTEVHEAAAATAVREDGVANNMKQIGLSIALYAQDYDDTLPATDSTRDLQEVSFPYLRNASVWRNLNPNGGRILFNTKVAGLPVNSVKFPAETVLLFDEKPWPDGQRWVCFVDGHTESLTEQEFRSRMAKKLPTPPRRMIRITGERRFPNSVLIQDSAQPAPPPPNN